MANCQKPGCDTGVLKLQETLKMYATATGFTAADPGEVDGIVGTNTVRAVAAIAPQIPGLPSEVRAVLGVAGFAAIFAPAEVNKTITRYASQIGAAVMTVYVARVASGKSPAPNGTVPNSNQPGSLVIPSGMWLPTNGQAGPTATTTLPTKAPPTAPYVPPKPDWWTTPLGIGLLAGGTVAVVGLMFLLGRAAR